MTLQLERLEIHAVDHCNFHCEHCSHFAPFLRKTHQADDYIPALQRLAQYADVSIIHILGGEPMLHPDTEIRLNSI